ncbi:hypothetical protein YC2023_062846 [Brassica napus]
MEMIVTPMTRTKRKVAEKIRRLIKRRGKKRVRNNKNFWRINPQGKVQWRMNK